MGAADVTPIFRHLPLVAALVAAPAAAQTFQDIAALERRVVGALNAGIGEPGGPSSPIDRRLKLAPCPTMVVIDPPALGAVALRCEPLGWRIRVPLARAQAPAATVAEARAPIIIKRGDPVQIYAESRAFRVTAEAIAQEDGAVGGRIRVKTDPKAPVVIAEVVDIGLVRIAGLK